MFYMLFPIQLCKINPTHVRMDPTGTLHDLKIDMIKLLFQLMDSDKGITFPHHIVLLKLVLTIP